LIGKFTQINVSFVKEMISKL